MNPLNTVATNLSCYLADAWTLYNLTHGDHWNVTGPQFHSLHLLFEAQYNEQWMALDLIAERVRALDAFPPETPREMLAHASWEPGKAISANERLRRLIEGHEHLIRNIKVLLEQASTSGDESTVGLLGERLTQHEKMRWMLKSSVG